ncbi:MAG: hypothetical protein PHR77_06000 [Kiritimatiellae bacterium]|nr:hypothetical protein [Kiritimatiellia bacterium]MDD5522476.1 hypothetical protein [Kiritimatiellia bacterium]
MERIVAMKYSCIVLLCHSKAGIKPWITQLEKFIVVPVERKDEVDEDD